ncbi:MAG: hypothetical protein HY053_04680 [Proteobacteria bacterium]|nr:hypothetical protein [Pseudomonadota bacterium]
MASPLVAQDIYVRPNTNKPAAPDLGIKANPKPVEHPTPQVAAPAPPPPPTYTPPASSSPINEYDQGAIIVKTSEKTYADPGTGPNSLHVALQAGGIGPQDRSSIADNLGLSEKEVQSSCYLRYQLMVMYGQDLGGTLNVEPGKAVDYKYSTPLRNLQVTTSVACRKLRHPLAGVILEQGDYYILSLLPVDCPIGDKANATKLSLIFRYLGDGNGECRYQ